MEEEPKPIHCAFPQPQPTLPSEPDSLINHDNSDKLESPGLSKPYYNGSDSEDNLADTFALYKVTPDPRTLDNHPEKQEEYVEDLLEPPDETNGL